MKQELINYLELVNTIKDLEAQRKQLSSKILAEMEAEGVANYAIDGIGVATIINKSNSKLNKDELKLALAARGVNYDIINEAFGAAISVGEPSKYVTVKGFKEEQ